MATESGFSNQKSYGPSKYKTIHNVSSDKFAENVVVKALIENSLTPIAITAVAVSTNLKTLTLTIPAHLAVRPGDVLKFYTGPLTNVELDIINVIDANTLQVYNVMEVLPVVTNTVKTCYYQTPSFSSSGGGGGAFPEQFVLNGVATNVSQDTVTPANSRPLPVRQLNPDGTVFDSTLVSKEAKQDSQITLATAGNVSLASLDTKMPTAGQKVMASSSPVVIASDQSAIPVTGPLTDTQLRATPVPISAAALPLPTGAATETTLAAINTKLPAQGQALMAASQPVVIASNQSAIPVTTSVTDVTNSGTITIINGNIATGAMNGVGTVCFQVTGTYTAVGGLTAQGTLDGTNWVALSGLVNTTTGVFAATIPSAAVGIYQTETAGYSQIRLIALGAVTGTATITLRGSRVSGLLALDAPIPAGTSIIGALVANQSTNIAQMNGIAVSMGTGVSGTGVQRVVLASDSPASPVPAAVTVKNAAIALGVTAVRMTTDGLAPSATRRTLSIMVDPITAGAAANPPSFYYGASTVTASGTTRGIPVFPGQNLPFLNDVNDYYIISDTATQLFFVVEAE